MSTVTRVESKKGGLLSRREREIARLVAQGFPNRQISDELYISEQTVKNHISHIFGKTGVRGRMRLAVYAANLDGH